MTVHINKQKEKGNLDKLRRNDSTLDMLPGDPGLIPGDYTSC